MNLLRMLMVGALLAVVAAVSLVMVACQAIVVAAVLGLSRLAGLVGGRMSLNNRPRTAAQGRGRTIEGECTVHHDARPSGEADHATAQARPAKLRVPRP